MSRGYYLPDERISCEGAAGDVGLLWARCSEDECVQRGLARGVKVEVSK